MFNKCSDNHFFNDKISIIIIFFNKNILLEIKNSYFFNIIIKNIRIITIILHLQFYLLMIHYFIFIFILYIKKEFRIFIKYKDILY